LKLRAAKVSMGEVFMTFLVALLGLVLTPTIQDTVTTELENLTGAAAAVAENIPLIWIFLCIGIIAAQVVRAYQGM